jgi:hypothetical protein
MRNTPKTRPAKPSAEAANPPQPQRNLPDTGKFPTRGPFFSSFLQVKLWSPR